MPQANICRGFVFVSENRASKHQERCICYNGKNQTNGTRDSLPVWPYPSYKPFELRKDHHTSIQKPYDATAEEIKGQVAIRCGRLQ